jgi:CHASE1-domain containing sensor protein
LNKHTVFVDQDDLKSSPDVRSNAVASDHADAQQTFSGSRLGWTWLFVLVVFVAGLYLVQDMWRYAETLAEAKFNQRKGEVVNAIRYRMDNYEQALRGGLGLFAASDSVSREEWHSYINVLDVQNQFPGIQGIGYSLWLNPSDVAAHIGTIRGDGFPDYTVHPNHDRDEYTAIIYLEPFDERNRKAFGYDMWSQEVRHFAMSNARDTVETTISGRVTLVQEIDADVQAGFLMYLPHYGGLGAEPTVAERRDALIGFVYSAFRMRDLMHGVVGDLEDIRVRIFDGTSNAPENQVFDSASAIDIGESAESPRFEASEILPIRGANWTLEFSSLPAFRKGDEAESQPLIVLIAVMVCGTLIGFVVWSWGGTQSRAGVMAETMLVSINRPKAYLLI